MRVLLDENLPHDLTGALIGHSVSTVQALGWAGTKNGALLKRASGLIDALVTMDRNLERLENNLNSAHESGRGTRQPEGLGESPNKTDATRAERPAGSMAMSKRSWTCSGTNRLRRSITLFA